MELESSCSCSCFRNANWTRKVLRLKSLLLWSWNGGSGAVIRENGKLQNASFFSSLVLFVPHSFSFSFFSSYLPYVCCIFSLRDNFCVFCVCREGKWNERGWFNRGWWENWWNVLKIEWRGHASKGTAWDIQDFEGFVDLCCWIKCSTLILLGKCILVWCIFVFVAEGSVVYRFYCWAIIFVQFVCNSYNRLGPFSFLKNYYLDSWSIVHWYLSFN